MSKLTPFKILAAIFREKDKFYKRRVFGPFVVLVPEQVSLSQRYFPPSVADSISLRDRMLQVSSIQEIRNAKVNFVELREIEEEQS